MSELKSIDEMTLVELQDLATNVAKAIDKKQRKWMIPRNPNFLNPRKL